MRRVPSEKCITLNREFEKLRLLAYPCESDKWTIGWGGTFYESGEPVKQGDAISEGRANELHRFHMELFARQVNACLKSTVNQDQFDALVDFNFNTGRLCKSTLIEIVNADPNHPDIEMMFLRWKYSKGKVSEGIIRRRLSQICLYRKGELKYDWTEEEIKSAIEFSNANG